MWMPLQSGNVSVDGVLRKGTSGACEKMIHDNLPTLFFGVGTFVTLGSHIIAMMLVCPGETPAIVPGRG